MPKTASPGLVRPVGPWPEGAAWLAKIAGLSRRRLTLAIGLCAFLVRVGLVLLQPFTIVRTSDAADYQRLAARLAQGHGWGVSIFAPGGGPTAFRDPLYPLFLAGIYKVFGVHITMGRLGGALLGALGVMLLAAATWMLWGRTVALVTGALAAVFPPMVITSTGLMTEALAIPLELAALACGLNFRRTRQLRWAALCGVALGLAVLTRANLAILLVPLVLVTLVRPFELRQLVPALVIVAVGTLTVTPWLVRDRLVFHQWIPLTTQDGTVLAGTYNHTSATDSSDPASWIPFSWDPTDRELIAEHPHANEVQESNLLQSAAVHYITSHPSYVVDVFYQNTLHMFDLVGLRWTRADIATSYGLSPIWGDADGAFTVSFLALAIVGIALPRSRKRVPVAYWAAPGLLWISTALLQGLPRFRAEIDPFVVQLSAVTILNAWTAVTRRSASDASSSLEIPGEGSERPQLVPS